MGLEWDWVWSCTGSPWIENVSNNHIVLCYTTARLSRLSLWWALILCWSALRTRGRSLGSWDVICGAEVTEVLFNAVMLFEVCANLFALRDILW